MDRENLPFELKSFIDKECRRARDSNQADYRPTSTAEINGIYDYCIKRYEAGKSLMATLSEEDMRRTRNLFLLDNEYDADRLTDMKVLGQWVIAPRHVGLIERMRKLREAII